jgi:hypothetical protein
MIPVDGRYAYAWKGWLFRAKDGVIQAKPQSAGVWKAHPVEGCPAVDDELGSRLDDLLEYWDKDA